MALDIALAASAREWPDRLHRHLLDHGGGRVVTRVMGPEQATESEFDLLLIDDICSFLTPRLVAMVKQSGSEVIGVFSPADGSDAKRRLLECGISDVIETEAGPREFLEKAHSTLAHRTSTFEPESYPRKTALTLGVTGAPGGVGITEVAVGLSQQISSRVPTALVDADQHWPSVAQRLDLPLHPNLRTALDSVMHGSNELGRSAHDLGELMVVGGIADRGRGAPVSSSHIAMLIGSLSQTRQVVVIDLGPQDRSVPGVYGQLDTTIVVGAADPVGVSRLIRVVGELIDRGGVAEPVLVINKVPKRAFYQSEVRAEISAAYPDFPLVLLPIEDRVAASAWEGIATGRGSFSKGIVRMASLVIKAVDDR